MMMMGNDLIGKEKPTTTISDLLDELLTEVLVRLSVKDILACVCVQKSWHSLIKTRMFINLYSSYHHKFSSNKYLLFWDECADTYTIRVDDIQCLQYLKFKYPPHLSHDIEFQLVSNGLICLFDFVTTTTIHLWNPVFQKYITLPDAPLPTDSTVWKDIAFGFVPQIDDYLVVLMGRYSLSDDEPFTNYVVTCVYSLSTKSWKKITLDDGMSMVYTSGECKSVFVNGVAIWAVINEQGDAALGCFDTKTEMSREISIPSPEKQNPSWFRSLQVFNQSIAYFVEDCRPGFRDAVRVWVLKGDPMNEFVWERKMMVDLRTSVTPAVMGIRNNGEPILCKRFHLISYYFDSCKSYRFVKSWNRWAPLFREAYDDWLHNEDGSSSSSPFAPFAITPFAESLGLLDVDCTQY